MEVERDNDAASVTEVDLQSLLFPGDGDVLVNGAGKEFKYDEIKGKVVGFVVGPHWLPSRLIEAVSLLVDPYESLVEKGKPLVIVYSTVDRNEGVIESLEKFGEGSQVDRRPDEESFKDVLQKMPAGWLAVPLGSAAVRSKIEELFRLGIFSLSFVGADGRFSREPAWPIVEKWGADAFPFTDERVQELVEEMEAAKANQTIQSLFLPEEGRDSLVRADGSKVKVSDLEGKRVGIYFSAHWCPPCRKFTPFLADVYKKLKEEKQELEVVFVSGDGNEEAFKEYLETMPWPAVPFSDKRTKSRLDNYFEVCGIPSLVLLDEHGKTTHSNAVGLVKRHGAEGFPYTPERFAELEQIKVARRTLEKALVTEERDFLVNQAGEETKVASLLGKTVGLYFSTQWSPACRDFTPKLVKVYNELKEQGKPFEVVFVSRDRNEESFREYHAEMPWLALPYAEREKADEVESTFDAEGTPTLVILAPDGKSVVTLDATALVEAFGAKAYPFSKEREEELHEEEDAEVQKYAKEVTVGGHPHPLVLMRVPYVSGQFECDICETTGRRWAYRCDECSYDVHVHCSAKLSEPPAVPPADGAGEEEGAGHDVKEGFVCEGDVCRKV